MDYFFLGNALLMFGAFALQFGLFEGSSSSDAAEEMPDNSQYQPNLYASEFIGTAGDDAVNGEGGALDQAFFLGDGNDDLDATFGNDYAEGGAGNDVLAMRPGDDIALGGAGDDTLYGNDGDDQMTGNKDDDELHGGAGNDTLLGSEGDDLLDGGTGDDALFGNTDADPAATDDGADTLLGGDGNDALHLAGGDLGTGGTGSDSFFLYDPEDSGGGIEITDYDPNDDVVGVVYTPTNDPVTGDPVVPTVSVTANSDGTAGIVSLDGVEIASITGGQNLTLDDISLIADDA